MPQVSIPGSLHWFLCFATSTDAALSGSGDVSSENSKAGSGSLRFGSEYLYAESFVQFDLSQLAGKQVTSCRFRASNVLQVQDFTQKPVRVSRHSGPISWVDPRTVSSSIGTVSLGSPVLNVPLPVPSLLLITLENPAFPVGPPSEGDGTVFFEAWLDVEYVEGGGGSVGGSLLDIAKAWTLNDDGESVQAPSSVSVSLLDAGNAEKTPRQTCTFSLSGNTATLQGQVTFPAATSDYTATAVAIWDNLGRKLVQAQISPVTVRAQDVPKLSSMTVSLTALSVGSKVLQCVFGGVPVQTNFPDINYQTRTRKLKFRTDFGIEPVSPASLVFMNAANVAQGATSANAAPETIPLKTVELLDAVNNSLWSKGILLSLQPGAKVVVPVGGLHA